MLKNVQREGRKGRKGTRRKTDGKWCEGIIYPRDVGAIDHRSDEPQSSFSFFIFLCVPSRPFASFAFQELGLFRKQQVEDLGVERQAEQPLRKRASSDFAEAG